MIVAKLIALRLWRGCVVHGANGVSLGSDRTQSLRRGSPLISPKFKVQRFRTWETFRDAIERDEYKGWAFRGQANADWPLYSSLSRYLVGFRVSPKAWSQQE